ncbi:hypothetical protein LguiB_026546 [Lonicera macranthoides]
MPGIWRKEQFEAQKPIVNAVQEKGGIFFCQIWHLGHVIDCSPEKYTQSDRDEINSIINDFKVATLNAIEAGFDEVEIRRANGYLIDLLIKDELNNEIDQYTRSIENSCHLALEVTKAVANEIGADKVGIKLSPFKMIKNEKGHYQTPRCLSPMRLSFKGTFIASGGYNKSDGDKGIVENYMDLVSFGRLFLANPDLPKRFEANAPLNKHKRNNLYIQDLVIGYTDYPFLQVAS